ncbi:MAG: Gfo/Idh/MocA family protein [Pseudomonadota bacterium]
MIDLAIVGLGRWGRVLVESVQGRSDAVRFTHAVTGTPAHAADYCRAHGLELRPTLEEVLADSGVHGVVLATPHSLHEAQVIAAAAAGKAVFCEKPFTLTVAAAERAVAAAERAGIVLAVGHNRRFLPALRRMHGWIEEGRIGRALHVEGNISSHVGGRYAPDSWRLDTEESPAGGMAGAGIHLVDAMIHLLGPIAEVQAQSFRLAHDVPLDDTTSMLFRFESGATGYLATLTATAPTFRLQVFGEAGSLELRSPTVLEHVPLGGERTLWTFPAVDIERAQLEAFASAIAGGPAFPVPLDEVVAGIRAFEAVPVSATEHRRILLDRTPIT